MIKFSNGIFLPINVKHYFVIPKANITSFQKMLFEMLKWYLKH